MRLICTRFLQPDLFRQGKQFHSVLEDVLSSGSSWESKSPQEKETHPPEVQGYMESVSHVVKDIGAVRAIETTVHHDKLNYLGIADCVARYRYISKGVPDTWNFFFWNGLIFFFFSRSQGCLVCYRLEDFREAQTIPEQHLRQPYSDSRLCWGP